MFIVGTVGAEYARQALLSALKQLTKLESISVAQLGQVWIASAGAESDGSYWQVGASHGHHVRIEIEGDGVVAITDSWAHRPFYYVRPLAGGAVFGTVLRPLTMTLKPELDFEGCCQTAMIGTSIGSRTRFAGVHRAHPASTIRIEAASIETTERPFWRSPLPGGGQALADCLRANTRLRAGGAKRVTTLLSGGLDSRVVVALLASEGYEVNALNYAKKGIQDEVYARAFAHAAGVQYISSPRRDGEMGQFHIAARRIAEEGIISDLPDVVWTGQAGGTLIAGSATESIIAALREGDFLTAAREHCASAHHSLPARLFRHSSAELEERVIGAIAHEMERYEIEDSGHSFMLFRLFNRVRHGADISYEGILEHRLDQYSPFVDETALRITLGLDPIELLRHKFYHEWLAVLPSSISAVPWQSYPGHLPSPVKADTQLMTQWQEGGTAYAKGKRRRSQSEAFQVLWQGQKELSQWNIAGALALDVSGLRNCRHMLDSAAAFLEP